VINRDWVREIADGLFRCQPLARARSSGQGAGRPKRERTVKVANRTGLKWQTFAAGPEKTLI
jgi:hypothetical protein